MPKQTGGVAFAGRGKKSEGEKQPRKSAVDLVPCQADLSVHGRAEQEIVRLNRLYSVLSRTNQTIIRARNQQELFEEACRIAVENGSFRMAWVGIVDEKNRFIKPVAVYGHDDHYLDTIRISIDDIPEGRGPTGTALRENRPFICCDIEHEPYMIPWRREALKRGYRSSAAFPLRTGDKVTGVYTVYSSEVDWFKDEEVKLLNELTSDISYAMDFMEKENLRKQAEEEVQILSRIPDENPNPVVRVTSEGILLYANPTSQPLLDMWQTWIGQPLPDEWRKKITDVFQSGGRKEEEVSCKDKVFSLILTPIVSAGYVNLYGRDITLGKQALAKLAHQTEELTHLYRASGILHAIAPFDRSARAQKIAEVIFEEFGFANCSVFLIDTGSNELNRIAVAGPYAREVSKTKLTLDGPGQVPQAIHSGQVINTPDVLAASAYFPSWEAARSELTLPLKVGEQVIGAIDIESEVPNAFQEEAERMLSIFTERAAQALEHADLYAKTERQLENLTSLREIDAAITGSFDLNLTLEILLNQVIQRLGVHAADVLTFSPVSQSFRFSAGQGFRTQALRHTDLRMGDGYAGQVAVKRQTITIQDLKKNTGSLARSADFGREGFQTYIGAPLIVKGQVKGVLELYHREALNLNQEQSVFLDMLAGQAAIAIDNAQLFEGLQSSNSELMMAYDETIEGWSRAMDLRDKETEGHTQRVTELTVRLANSMGFGIEEIVQVRRGALLHDIGKLGIPDEILLKPGPLTEEEWVIMKKHPQFAYDLIAPIVYLRPAIDIPYCHHEKWDGTGYPRGLKGEQIPRAARIFAVVDVWDALSSDRPYRKAWPKEKILEHIRSLSGTHFDPEAVELFLRVAIEGRD
jgi:HD-GYP domain-containing protein (c-di-GMP phosphodiesterase class II)